MTAYFQVIIWLLINNQLPLYIFSKEITDKYMVPHTKNWNHNIHCHNLKSHTMVHSLTQLYKSIQLNSTVQCI
jgi:hypothetical protein